MNNPIFTAAEEVRKAINENVDKLYHVEADGTAKPLVCALCDRFVGPNWTTITKQTLKKKKIC